MKVDSLWTCLSYVFELLSGNTVQDQLPLGQGHTSNVVSHVDNIGSEPLMFEAPRDPRTGEGFICEYPRMRGYRKCHENDKHCWIKSHDGRRKFDINSDYENPKEVPLGITRRFELDIGEMPLSPDGVTMEHGKVFNRQYPGPWIQACWGDTIEVTVTNKLQYNGTSVHFHGIRQLNTPHMDGVNGITQCPIAPGDTFTYKFRALQYGSSWYHSHYSLQYGDGMLGPMTIYGPTTAQYDLEGALEPILMTDWNHRSVFEAKTGAAPKMTNILLNGNGQYGSGPDRPEKFNMTFEEGKKYLLILINTAVDTTFIFSIDEHLLQVVETDFVPIVPYYREKLRIGIGQRYHVIVHAKPRNPARHNNYWIRTIPARQCSKFACGPDEKMGILRYNTTKPDSDKDPLSTPFLFDIQCADEPYEEIIPWKKWRVGNPANNDLTKTEFQVSLKNSSGVPYVPDKRLLRWDMHLDPFRINFSDPTILSLERETWPRYTDVVTVDTPDDGEDHWIWLLITAPYGIPSEGGERMFVPAAHPMHLHGHDFALLRQSTTSWEDDKHNFTLDCSDERVKCDNPPRRDVALLPAYGYLIIAFKADNPGKLPHL
ncbi:uncharacterized protein BP5553_04573 [Venustampulla echinocandica]|uniref:Cupredoxin n=1 Tax=Venustampulla echinocandica TaxID=2656787 RepID=A0A370TNP4_9HELO|nr:uncharacterized protein BP5553_04573 [Venustampulla echinocandica]RDL37140.1 hypothetical protein BP5553_04573 [Venustampulla echinocandica]